MAATGRRFRAPAGAGVAGTPAAVVDTLGDGAGVATVGNAVGVVTSCWSAWASSNAVENRSAGTSASARWSAKSAASGTLGRPRRTLGTGSLKRLATMACAVGPVYGASPASIS